MMKKDKGTLLQSQELSVDEKEHGEKEQDEKPIKQTLFQKIKPIIIFTINASSIYLLWIILHYIASHLYVKYCVPNSLFGFIISPFMVSTRHCMAIRWIIYHGANSIDTMWIILGTWITSKLNLMI